MQAITPDTYLSRLNFVCSYLQTTANETPLADVLFTDKDTFTRLCMVNIHNFHLWVIGLVIHNYPEVSLGSGLSFYCNGF